MPLSPILIDDNRSDSTPKGVWEDPCITLERDLDVRAQGGPPDPGGFRSGPGYLGPLGGQPGSPGSC